MKMSIDYIDLLSTCTEVQSFKTSLGVIGKVLNVPESALKALLRLNGYDDNIEPSSICIDEEMLAIFAEAYVRKMRSYFLNSNRHLNLLSPQEAADLEQFYQTFKKKGDYKTNSRDWNHIDTDLISEVFVQKVKKETPRQSSFGVNSFELLQNIIIEIDGDLYRKPSTKIEELPLSYTQEWYIPDEISALCDRIANSRFYVLKITNLLIQQYLALSSFYIKSICVFARYYIFSSEGSENDLPSNSLVLKF